MELQKYIDAKFYLFPVSPKTKKPCIRDNLNKASIDIDQLNEWAQQFEGCNWGLSLAKSGLVAVDVDVKHSGLEVWESLTLKHEEPKTLKARSGGGGYHYVFSAEKGAKYRGKITKGIDVKHNGYILVAPSIHPSSGLPYIWDNKIKPASVPSWLDELIKKHYSAPNISPIQNASDDYLERCVKILKEQDLDYEEWTQAGMAIHSAMPDARGRDLFIDLTSGVAFEDGDIEKARDKWDGFTRSGGVTLRTLTYIIKEKGEVPPNPTLKEDIEAFKQAQKEECRQKELESAGFSEKKGRMICWSEKEIVKFFNDEGYCFFTGDLNSPFLKVNDKGSGSRCITSMKLNGLRDLTATYYLAEMREEAERMKTQYTPAYKVWVSSIKRKEFDTIQFEPKKAMGERDLNLWLGFPYANNDVKGKPNALLNMIHESLCNGDTAKTEWLLDWLAHIIQYPEVKATTVPVLIGLEGTGKGLLFDYVMREILQDFYVTMATSKEVTGDFNSHAAGKLLSHIDEATWRGNKTEDGILKSRIGSPTISINEKFKIRYTISNYSRYAVSSNNNEAVALGVGNRRYCVIETSDKYAADVSYFDPIARTIKEEHEAIKFFNFLSNRDISGFSPYKILEGNTAGMTSKIATEGTVAEFWYDLFYEEPRSILYGDWLVKNAIFKDFLEYAKTIKSYEKSFSAKHFWEKTKKIIPFFKEKDSGRIRIDGKRERVLHLPHPGISMLRDIFEKNMQINKPGGESIQDDEYQVASFLDTPGSKEFLT